MLKKVSATLIATISLAVAGDKINGAGASFPAPLYYDWAHNYEKETGNKINYQSIGSGGGIKQIGARMVDFGASDEPLDSTKLAKDKLLQFPAAIGSIAIVYNIPNVKDGQVKLKNEIVAEIFAGKITKWNDEKIVADNKDVKLPDEKITVVRRSDGSGTTYNFTDYLTKASEMWKGSIGTGKSVDWPVGIGGKGNEGVSNLVKETPFSVGYVESAYKEKENLSAAVLTTASGKWVEAKEENFKAAAAYAKWTGEEHFYQLLSLQPGDNSYPIVAATFILVPQEKEKTEMNKKVIQFFDYAFKNGDETAKKLGYIPLPAQTKEMITKYWKTHSIQ